MLKTSLQSWLVIFFFFVLRMYLAIRLIYFRHIFCVLCSFLTTMQLFFFFWCINYPEQTVYTYRQRVHIINSSLIVSVMRLLVFELNNIEWCWGKKFEDSITFRYFLKCNPFAGCLSYWVKPTSLPGSFSLFHSLRRWTKNTHTTLGDAQRVWKINLSMINIFFKFLPNSNLKGSAKNEKSWWFFNILKLNFLNCVTLHVRSSVEKKN